jgi:excisionase family DNA binding protein
MTDENPLEGIKRLRDDFEADRKALEDEFAESRARFSQLTDADWKQWREDIEAARQAEGDEPAERQWLSVDEAADVVGLSSKTIRRAIDRKELKASKVRNRVRINLDDVEAWLRDNPAPTHEVPDWP